jgi:hypothetical protein
MLITEFEGPSICKYSISIILGIQSNHQNRTRHHLQRIEICDTIVYVVGILSRVFFWTAVHPFFVGTLASKYLTDSVSPRKASLSQFEAVKPYFPPLTSLYHHGRLVPNCPTKRERLGHVRIVTFSLRLNIEAENTENIGLRRRRVSPLSRPYFDGLQPVQASNASTQTMYRPLGL